MDQDLFLMFYKPEEQPDSPAKARGRELDPANQ